MLNITLIKLKYNFCSSFLWTLTQEWENAIRIIVTTKYSIFGAKKLCQPRKFYTTAGWDVWDIKKAWGPLVEKVTCVAPVHKKCRIYEIYFIWRCYS